MRAGVYRDADICPSLDFLNCLGSSQNATETHEALTAHCLGAFSLREDSKKRGI
jgi:hypothetical protein